jgi:N-acetylneuraminate synthase
MNTKNTYQNLNINKLHTIAEIGINHNGDIDIAKKLIANSKKAGFHSVKFQKRTIDLVYSKEILDSFRESPWGKTQRKQKEGLEFGKKEYDEIDKFCKELEINWFASAWDTQSLDFLDQYNLEYAKVASAMIVDKNFLMELAKRKKYTFISTGMSTLKEIASAVEIFEKANCPYELMHCVSTYPAIPEDINLNTIYALKKLFNCRVGYSGHENGIAISLAAVVMGATSLERHITLDRTMYGSDQAASIEMKGMTELISSIKKILIAQGEEKVGYITEKEFEIAKKLRAHILN